MNLSDPEIAAKELVKERTLWDMMLACRPKHLSRMNGTIVVCFTAIGVTQGFIVEASTQERVAWIMKFAEVGLNFSTAILGFLIAGFALLAAVRSPTMIVRMATTRDPETGGSYLKANYYSLVHTFVYFLIFVMLCFTTLMIGTPKGIASTFLNALPQAKPFCVGVASTVLAGGTGWLLASLKSFIRNIVHIVMTGHGFEVKDAPKK